MTIYLLHKVILKIKLKKKDMWRAFAILFFSKQLEHHLTSPGPVKCLKLQGPLFA